MSYQATFIIVLDRTQTSETLRAQLVNSDGTNNGSLVTTGFANLSNGEYSWVGTIPDSFKGWAQFSSVANGYQTSCPINGELPLIADIDSKVQSIGSATVTVVNPVATDQTITIVRGDDYSSGLGNRPSWSSSTWPNLTGATVKWACRSRYSGELALSDIACVISNAGQASQTVTLPLARAQTSMLALGTRQYEYDIEATTTAGDKITLVRGEMTVLEDIQGTS